MKEIILTGGHVVLVDDCDYEKVSAFKWKADKRQTSNGVKVYAFRTITKLRYDKLSPTTVTGTRKTSLYMHKFILQYEAPFVCDHIDGNPLNNQRSNLRICSQAENAQNSFSKRRNKTSVYKGVFSRYGKWAAMIRHNYKGISLGVFANEIDAALAYDAAAKRIFGAFAKTNF